MSLRTAERALLILSIFILYIACDSTDNDTTPPPPPEDVAPLVFPDGALIIPSEIESLTEFAQSLEENVMQEARFAPGIRAEVGDLDSDATGGMDVFIQRLGWETETAHDIDQDGTDEVVGLFIIDFDWSVYLFWQEEITAATETESAVSDCFLSWVDILGVTWTVRDQCGGSQAGSIVCNQAGNSGVATCNQCPESICRTCYLEENEIYCDPNYQPYTPGGDDPDMGSDAPVEELPGWDIPGDSTGGDIPSGNNGECNSTCLDQPGAVCCFDCTCDAEISCVPECPDADWWDCLMNCCWDVELGCLVID
jgi:hypothetical protein